jgi:hypothetical protein
MPRPDFHEKDTVMLCHHLYEDATRGKLSLQWNTLQVEGRFNPPKAFNREDGTKSASHWTVACSECARLPANEIDYVEEIWRHGRLHVADHLLHNGHPGCR